MPPLVGQAGYSGLAERPRVSLGLNKGGFGERRPSGSVLSKPKWREMLAGVDYPSRGTKGAGWPDQKCKSHCISVLWGRCVPAWKKVKFACGPAGDGGTMPFDAAGTSRTLRAGSAPARADGARARLRAATLYCRVKTDVFQTRPEKNVAPSCSHLNAGVRHLAAWQTPHYLPWWRGRGIGGGCGVCWAGSWSGTLPWLLAGVDGQPA